MGHGRHVTGSSYPTPTPTPPVADYNVATNPALNPDCSCNYFLAGTYGGKNYYRRIDGLYFIYWDGDAWTIAPHAPAELLDPYWLKNGEEIIGEYDPYGGAVGIATVSTGQH